MKAVMPSPTTRTKGYDHGEDIEVREEDEPGNQQPLVIHEMPEGMFDVHSATPSGTPGAVQGVTLVDVCRYVENSYCF